MNDEAKVSMQIDTFNKKQTLELLDKARRVAIIPAKTAGASSYCAAAGLYLLLREKYEEDKKKSVNFIFQGKIPNECENLIEKDQIRSNLSERDVMISIDYTNTGAKKVQYSTDDDVLVLKLGPVSKNFNLNRVKARIVGHEFDLIITVGAQELLDLGQMYHSIRDEVHAADIINIDNTSLNKRFGILNIVETEAESLSALVFKKAGELGMVPNHRAAKALLKGMSTKIAN